MRQIDRMQLIGSLLPARRTHGPRPSRCDPLCRRGWTGSWPARDRPGRPGAQPGAMAVEGGGEAPVKATKGNHRDTHRLHRGIHPLHRDVETDGLLQNLRIVDRADGRFLVCHLAGNDSPALLLFQKCQQRRRIGNDQDDEGVASSASASTRRSGISSSLRLFLPPVAAAKVARRSSAARRDGSQPTSGSSTEPTSPMIRRLLVDAAPNGDRTSRNRAVYEKPAQTHPLIVRDVPEW